MWELSNKLQIIGFLYSIILGMIFAAFYDIFRALRIVKKPTALSVLFQDILYFFTISILTFIFLLAITNGEIRGYILFGEIVGFLIFLALISRFFIKILIFILNLFLRLYKCFFKGFYFVFEKIDGIFMKFLKNSFKCLKKGLKKVKGLLYTSNAV